MQYATQIIGPSRSPNRHLEAADTIDLWLRGRDVNSSGGDEYNARTRRAPVKESRQAALDYAMKHYAWKAGQTEVEDLLSAAETYLAARR